MCHHRTSSDTFLKRVSTLARTAHAWAGAVLSLLLIVISLSGTLLVFKDDYIRATIDEAHNSLNPAPAVLSLITETVETRFSPGSIRSLVFAGPHLGISKLSLTSGKQIYINAKGAPVAILEDTARLEEWMFDLHHHLFAGDIGKFLTGIAGLAAAIIIITGLIALWPARRAFSFRIWPRTYTRTSLLAAHRNIGLLSALPLLVVVLTGTGIVFSSSTKSILSVFNDKEVHAHTELITAGSGDIDWDLALHLAQEEFSGARIRSIRWPQNPGDPAIIRIKQASEWHPNGRTYIMIDPANSTIINIKNAETAPRGDRIFNTFYPIHAARLGAGMMGRFYDITMALFGLSMSLLGCLGLYTFLKKRGTLRSPRRAELS